MVLPLLLAACGGSSTHKVSGDPIGPAVTKTLEQGSENVAVEANVELSGQSVKVKGNGAFGRDAGQLHLSFDVPMLGTSTLDERVKGGVAWVSSPLLSSALHGKHWLRIELGKPAKLFGLDLAPLLVAQSPASLLGELGRGSNLEDLGGGSVGGVSTTHYRVDVGAAGSKALQTTEDAWIDDQRLVRKISRDVAVPSAGGKPAHTVVTMTFSDFGTTVSATPPPASDVLDSSELRK